MQSRNRDTDIKNGCVDMERGMNQSLGLTYTHCHVGETES